MPNHLRLGRLGTANVHEQTHDQVRQIETAIESIGERAKVVVVVVVAVAVAVAVGSGSGR